MCLAELIVDALIGHAYAKDGKRRKSTVILKRLITVNEETLSMVSPHYIAEIYEAMGQKDEAFRWLNKANCR